MPGSSVSVSTLNMIVDGSSAPAQKALADLEREAERVPRILNEMNPVRAGTERDTRKFLQAINQLSFGIEDFLTVFGTSGFTGGMRAASNNIGMTARILSPGMTGAIVGVATALGGILLPQLLGWRKETETQNDALERQREILKGLRDEGQQQSELRRENEQAAKVKSVEEAEALLLQRREKLKDITDQNRVAQDALNESRQKVIGLLAQINQRNIPEAFPGSLPRLNNQRDIIASLSRDFENLDRFLARVGANARRFGDVIEDTLSIRERASNNLVIERQIEKLEEAERAILGQVKLTNQQRERALFLIREAEVRLKQLREEQAKETLPQALKVFSADAEKLNRNLFNDIAGPIGRQLTLQLEKAKRAFGELRALRKEQDQAEDLRGRLRVAAVEDETQRKIEAVREELRLDEKRIDSLKRLTRVEREELQDLAREKARVRAQDILEDRRADIIKDLQGRSTSAGQNFARRDTAEGASQINQAILRALSQRSEQDQLALEIKELNATLTPVIQKLNRALDDGAKLVPLKLKGR